MNKRNETIQIILKFAAKNVLETINHVVHEELSDAMVKLFEAEVQYHTGQIDSGEYESIVKTYSLD